MAVHNYMDTAACSAQAWQWRAAHCCARRPWRMRVPWRSSSPAVTFAAQRTAGSDGSVSMNDGAGLQLMICQSKLQGTEWQQSAALRRGMSLLYSHVMGIQRPFSRR